MPYWSVYLREKHKTKQANKQTNKTNTGKIIKFGFADQLYLS